MDVTATTHAVVDVVIVSVLNLVGCAHGPCVGYGTHQICEGRQMLRHNLF